MLAVSIRMLFLLEMYKNELEYSSQLDKVCVYGIHNQLCTGPDSWKPCACNIVPHTFIIIQHTKLCNGTVGTLVSIMVCSFFFSWLRILGVSHSCHSWTIR